ncbi:MAG: hypothetical protein KAH01_05345, partial [Caldisericia bacterium]|nr:hypothetical protein [Caldisericia bacterium]
MGCNKTIKTKAELKRFIRGIKTKNVKVGKKKEGKKETRLASNAVSPSQIIRLFTDKHDTAARDKALDEVRELVKGSDRTFEPSFWKKIRGLKNQHPNLTSIFHLNKRPDGVKSPNEEVKALELAQRGLAMHHLFGAIKSEIDLMEKYNLTEDQVKELIPPGTVVPNIAALGSLAAIGRDIMFHAGMTLVPRPLDGTTFTEAQLDVERTYSQAGLKALKELETAGFISINFVGDKNEDGKIINRRFRKMDTDQYASANLIEGAVITINMDSMIHNINGRNLSNITPKNEALLKKFMMKESNQEESNEAKDLFPMLHANIKGAEFMHRLLVPSNEQGPDLEPGITSYIRHDVRVSEETKNTLKEKNKGGLVVNPVLSPMLDYIYEVMDKRGKSFEETISSLMPGSAYKRFAGYNSAKDSTAATRDSDRGRSLSKTIPFADFMENYKDMQGQSFYLQEEMKRNGRGHNMNTYVNPQTDKFFSRFMLSIPEYEIDVLGDSGNYSPLFAHLVNAVVDQGSNIDDNAVMHYGVNKELDELVDLYDDVVASGDGKRMSVFMSQSLYKFDIDLGGSVFQQIDTLSGILSIRNAISDNNGKLKGTFMPKPDGTASGAVIKAFQMAGKYKDSSLISDLGFNGTNTNAYNDAYDITLRVLNEEMKVAEKAHKNEVIGYVDAIKFMNDNGIIASIREAAKISSMPVMYSQGKNSAIESIGKDMADLVYRKLERDPRNKEVGSKIKEWVNDSETTRNSDYFNSKGEVVNINELTNKEMLNDKNSRTLMNDLNHYHSEVTATGLQDIIQENFIDKYLAENNDEVSVIFKEIQRAYKKKNERITLIPPEVLYNAYREKNGLSPTDDLDFSANGFKMLTEDDMVALELGKNGKPNNRGIPMMKLFETVVNPKQDLTTLRLEMPHEINANVVSVHSIDFAILTEGFRKTIAQFQNDPEMKAILESGTVSVHDAISAHPVFSLAYQKNYRRAMIEINAVYDINEQLARRLNSMEGADKAVSDKLLQNQQKLAAKKLKFLSEENIDFDSNKVFGFEESLKTTPKFGTTRPAKSTESRKKFDKDVDNSSNKEMATRYIPVSVAKKAYNALKGLWDSNKEWNAIDVETSGYANGKPVEAYSVDGYGKVTPSEVIQVRVQKMTGSNNGEAKTFYFKPKKMSSGAMKAHGFNTNFGDPMNINTLYDAQGIGSNKEVMAELIAYMGGNTNIAYNAKFDIDSMIMSMDSYGEGDGSFNSDIADSFAASIHASRETGKEVGYDGGNKLEDMSQKFLGEWDQNSAHNAEYDVDQMVKVMRQMFSDVDNKSQSEAEPETETKTTVEERADRTVEANKKSDTLPAEVIDLLNNSKNEIILDLVSDPSVLDNIVNTGNFEYYSGNNIIGVDKEGIGEHSLEQAMAHEAVHYGTIGYMDSIEGKADRNVKYLGAVVSRLQKDIKAINKKFKHVDGSKEAIALERLNYIISDQQTKQASMAELEAVLKAEPSNAAEIYKMMNSFYGDGRKTKGLKAAVDAIWNAIKSIILTQQNIVDAKNGKIEVEVLQSVVNGIYTAGIDFNSSKPMSAKKGRERYAKREFKKGRESQGIGKPNPNRSSRKQIKELLDYAKKTTKEDNS